MHLRVESKLEAGTLDAAFFVSSPQGEIVRNLLHSGKTEPVNFERAEAYARRYSFLTSLLLPEGSEDLASNLPDRDLHLLAVTASLVNREELHPAVIGLLMQVLEEVHGKGGWFEAPGEFPTPDYLSFSLSPQAARYYKNGPPFLQRYLPFWAASFLDRMKIMILPLLGLMLPMFKIVPPLYRWRMRSRIYRWYEQLEAVDTRAANARGERSRGRSPETAEAAGRDGAGGAGYQGAALLLRPALSPAAAHRFRQPQGGTADGG